ncbi:hypothetical protein PtB15_8B612 [Puccinia triticina]|nr:hypothetical protein PtB15_8B612 [Puccinia triticina]
MCKDPISPRLSDPVVRFLPFYLADDVFAILESSSSSAALEKATRSMLKACADSSSKHDQAHPAADKEVDQKEVALLLSRTA